jgi:hypothetical protein
MRGEIWRREVEEMLKLEKGNVVRGTLGAVKPVSVKLRGLALSFVNLLDGQHV